MKTRKHKIAFFILTMAIALCSFNQKTEVVHKQKVHHLKKIADKASIRSGVQNPIDKKLQDCIKSKNYTNLGERECLTQALQDWDAALNKNYRHLKTILSSAHFRRLKESQRTWIAFRDKEYTFIESQYEGIEGSMYPNMILRQKIEIIKSRTLELADYIEKIEVNN